MKFRTLISQMLAVLAVMGLLLTPMVRPASAMPANMADMMDMAGDNTAMDMPADMPCCPDQAPKSDCTKDCPFLALCISGSVLNLPASAGLLLPLEAMQLVFPDNNADFASLNYDPPLRPPKH